MSDKPTPLSMTRDFLYLCGNCAPVWAHMSTCLTLQGNVLRNQGVYESMKVSIPSAVATLASKAIPKAVDYAMGGAFNSDDTFKTWVFPTHLATSGLMNVFAYYVYHSSSSTQAQLTGLTLQIMSTNPLSVSIRAVWIKMLPYFQMSNQDHVNKTFIAADIAAIFSSLAASRVISRSGLDPILSTGVSIGTFFAVSLIALPIFASIIKPSEEHID